MEILVLVKPVPEPESRLRPSSDGRRLDAEGFKWVLAGYDESAVEQALLLKESTAGSTVRALTFSPAPRGEEVLRACLALGCDQASWVEMPADFPPAPLRVAHVLASAVARYPHAIVLCGKQSGDEESGLVPAAIGEFLGEPSFDYVVNLRVVGERFTFDRSVAGGTETIEQAAPLVVGLQQAWNDPRTAKLPNILKSRRIPIERIPLDAGAGAPAPGEPAALERVEFRLPPPRTGARMIEYATPEEAAQKLVRVLKEEAKVFP